LNNDSTTESWQTEKTVHDYVINGDYSEAFALFVDNASRKKLDGTIITSTGVCMAAATTWKTGCSSILTVIDRCITLITKAHRCVLQWAFEMLERLAGKLARAVLRGGGGGNATPLPDLFAPAGPTKLRNLSSVTCPFHHASVDALGVTKLKRTGNPSRLCVLVWKAILILIRRFFVIQPDCGGLDHLSVTVV
jgi:hypothetical protein